MSLLALLAALAWVYLWLLHGRFWQDGPVLPPSHPGIAPPVDVIVPARNEAASIVTALRSLLDQAYAGPLRVILVDDRSTDDTGTLARALADPRLTVLTGTEPPPGWSGKLWAVSQGVAASTAPLLLLTDADIEHAPDHLARLVGKVTHDHLALVSEMVALNCQSAAERWLVPAFVYFFQLLYPFALVNDRTSRVAAAAGGTMLVRTEALAGIGGIASLHDALIDDVTLATRLKHAGGGIWLGHTRQAISRRPYPGAGDIWRMVARTAFVQLRMSWALLAACLLGLGLVFLLPPLAVLFGHGAARLWGAFGWAAMAGSFVPSLRRFGLSPWRAASLPLVAAFYMAATLGSAIDHARGLGVRWKDRAYTPATRPDGAAP